MLTPMMVQYLVGLCCLRRNPDAVDVTVGDRVLDTAAEKRRDVDITVIVNETDGRTQVFKAYEVKREGEPLDVAVVEGLCLKLRDMPVVTDGAIVSASGFTDGAVAKARAHAVQLFEFKPWTQPLSQQFPAFNAVGTASEFVRGVTSALLCWVNWRLQFVAPDGPESFNWDQSTPVFSSDGSVHTKFPSAGGYADAVLLRSTGILFALDPAQAVLRTFPLEPAGDNLEVEVGPPWPHTHTLDIREDGAFLKLGTKLVAVRSATISGFLQWQKTKRNREFYILEQVGTHKPFAAAAVADWGDPEGSMLAMIFGPESMAIDVHPRIQLLEKHKNAIRQLKLRQRLTEDT